MIVKVRGGYNLLTHNGSRVLGHHRTRAEALAQERAIYASKARRGRRNPSTDPWKPKYKIGDEIKDAYGTVGIVKRYDPGYPYNAYIVEVVTSHYQKPGQDFAIHEHPLTKRVGRGRRRNPSTSVDDGGRHRALNRLADAYRDYAHGEWSASMPELEELANRVSTRERAARSAGVSTTEIRRMYGAIRAQEKGVRHNPPSRKRHIDLDAYDRNLGPGYMGLYRITDEEAKWLAKHSRVSLPLGDDFWKSIRVELPDGRYAWIARHQYAPRGDRLPDWYTRNIMSRGWIWTAG